MTRPPRITDPRAVPVTGVDHHLPPVPADQLTAQALRERFARLPQWTPESHGDGGVRAGRGAARAAVLVALLQRGTGLDVLLTRRTDHLRDHAGQIAFPGGRAEPGDADPAATALREAHEEVGLAPVEVEIIGTMPVYTTITGFVVTPVIGLVSSGPDLAALAPDPHEVAEVFEVPLVHLMDPAHHRRHVFHFEGDQRQFLSMPWQGIAADGTPREYFIWGATAAMLRNLYRFLVG